MMNATTAQLNQLLSLATELQGHTVTSLDAITCLDLTQRELDGNMKSSEASLHIATLQSRLALAA
ncbi:hypothetical protein [Auritidibacter sp. NML100628]|uniref:hypothetical protein n=1 Tax=Auritidibacter sp. NML100628 TaxID=2170742 RepID=UPI0011B27EEC|nr:hypothetical protein [Auritidibacter sp. NML100628]